MRLNNIIHCSFAKFRTCEYFSTILLIINTELIYDIWSELWNLIKKEYKIKYERGGELTMRIKAAINWGPRGNCRPPPPALVMGPWLFFAGSSSALNGAPLKGLHINLLVTSQTVRGPFVIPGASSGPNKPGRGGGAGGLLCRRGVRYC